MQSLIWPEGTERVLDSLSKEQLIKDYIFVGGSALSYHIKHRLSEDIDLFTPSPALNNESVNNIVNNIAKKGYYIEDIGVPFSETHRKFLIIGIKVEFVASGRDFLKDEHVNLRNNLKIANLNTVAGMKAFTITQRKEIRDYYDNYIIAERFGLDFPIKQAKNLYGGQFSEKAFLSALIAGDKIFKEDCIEERLFPSIKISREEICSFFKIKVKEYLKNSLSYNQKPDSIEPVPLDLI
ncbi:MAG: nucleotidyl transferase AbiEii/AbiGii toxin family protein [bacterium]